MLRQHIEIIRDKAYEAYRKGSPKISMTEFQAEIVDACGKQLVLSDFLENQININSSNISDGEELWVRSPAVDVMGFQVTVIEARATQSVQGGYPKIRIDTDKIELNASFERRMIYFCCAHLVAAKRAIENENFERASILVLDGYQLTISLSGARELRKNRSKTQAKVGSSGGKKKHLAKTGKLKARAIEIAKSLPLGRNWTKLSEAAEYIAEKLPGEQKSIGQSFDTDEPYPTIYRWLCQLEDSEKVEICLRATKMAAKQGRTPANV